MSQPRSCLNLNRQLGHFLMTKSAWLCSKSTLQTKKSSWCTVFKRFSKCLNIIFLFSDIFPLSFFPTTTLYLTFCRCSFTSFLHDILENGAHLCTVWVFLTSQLGTLHGVNLLSISIQYEFRTQLNLLCWAISQLFQLPLLMASLTNDICPFSFPARDICIAYPFCGENKQLAVD